MVLQYVTAAMPKYLTRVFGPKCARAQMRHRAMTAAAARCCAATLRCRATPLSRPRRTWLTRRAPHSRAADSVPVGFLVAIQPALCVFLVPLVTAAAAHVPPLRMIAAGAAVSSLALLWLVVDVSIWAVVAFMVTLALGEAMWAPRLFEYTAAASPAGASCTWSALGAMPMFLAKLPTGLMSGALLETVRTSCA
jgi:hypothetical protein